jgi:chromosome segregation ATPase
MTALRRALFGYSSASVHALLADRERMFERASREAQSAEQRAARLASELQDTQQRIGEIEERLSSANEIGQTLAADLERSIVEREAMQAQIISLQDDLTSVGATLAEAQSAVAATEQELRASFERTAALEAELGERARERDGLARELASAGAVSAELQEELRQRSELLARAQAEASEAQASLRRALEEAAEHGNALSAERVRGAELEELLATRRIELERAPATPSQPEGALQDSEGPSTWRELATVLHVTEETVVGIMESARTRAEEELRGLDEDRERIGREVETMMAWRDEAAPMITLLRSTMDEAVRRADEIGVCVNEVLRPVTGVVTRMSSQLSSLDSLSAPTPPSTERAEEPSHGARVIELPDEQTAGREARREQ